MYNLKTSNNKNLTAYKMVIYLVVFYSLWSIRELIVRPIMVDSLDDLAFQIVGAIIKLLVWTIPAVILIKHYESDMWISLKEMLKNKVKWWHYISVLIAFFIYNLVSAWISFGKVEIHQNFVPTSLIGMVLFVGVTEEAVFRGWLLNALLKKTEIWHAILLNAFLFILIHYPIWIYKGYDFTYFISGSISVLLLSIIFSWAFIKSKNIFVPMVLHMSWNLFNNFFFGS